MHLYTLNTHTTSKQLYSFPSFLQFSFVKDSILQILLRLTKLLHFIIQTNSAFNTKRMRERVHLLPHFPHQPTICSAIINQHNMIINFITGLFSKLHHMPLLLLNHSTKYQVNTFLTCTIYMYVYGK
jgi:hypothetical protein